MFKSPIAELLVQKIKASSLIVVMSMAIALACAVPLGVWAAVHRDRWQDAASSSMALVGVSLPDFFWGIMMILLFARTLGWFPSSGFADPAVNSGLALTHAFLPALALGLGLMAHLTRMTRSTMTGILGQEFIRVGRAKGLSERTIVWRYALANAIGPVMTVAGLQVGYLFGSIIVIETLFNYTGHGVADLPGAAEPRHTTDSGDGVRDRGGGDADQSRGRPALPLRRSADPPGVGGDEAVSDPKGVIGFALVALMSGVRFWRRWSFRRNRRPA